MDKDKQHIFFVDETDRDRKYTAKIDSIVCAKTDRGFSLSVEFKITKIVE